MSTCALTAARSSFSLALTDVVQFKSTRRDQGLTRRSGPSLSLRGDGQAVAAVFIDVFDGAYLDANVSVSGAMRNETKRSDRPWQIGIPA